MTVVGQVDDHPIQKQDVEVGDKEGGEGVLCARHQRLIMQVETGVNQHWTSGEFLIVDQEPMEEGIRILSDDLWTGSTVDVDDGRSHLVDPIPDWQADR